jgi:hypothetical protein
LNRSKKLLADFNINDHPLVGVPAFSSSFPTHRGGPVLLSRSLCLQTRFTTSDDDHVGDDYFLTSGDKIRFFLEKDVLDRDGKLIRPKEKAVNKIGHG